MCRIWNRDQGQHCRRHRLDALRSCTRTGTLLTLLASGATYSALSTPYTLAYSPGQRPACEGPASGSVQSQSSTRRPQRRSAMAARTRPSCAQDARAQRRLGPPRRSSSARRGRFLYDQHRVSF